MESPNYPPSFSPNGPPATRSVPIIGRWKDEEHGAIVDVEEKEGLIIGRIVSTPLPGVDAGTEVFRNLVFDRKKRLWLGQVYAPRRNKVYEASYKVEGDTLAMRVTFGLLWKTVPWKRVY